MATLSPALFFFVNGEFFIHSCPLADGECYGEFVNYPYSHMDIWDRFYTQKYSVDFDYFPRGRIVFRKTDCTFLIYYDKCTSEHVTELLSQYAGCRYEIAFDEHYQCHGCNPGYVL